MQKVPGSIPSRTQKILSITARSITAPKAKKINTLSQLPLAKKRCDVLFKFFLQNRLGSMRDFFFEELVQWFLEIYWQDVSKTNFYTRENTK